MESATVINLLCDDAWYHIFSFLPINAWYNLMCTCYSFHDKIRSSNLFKQLANVESSTIKTKNKPRSIGSIYRTAVILQNTIVSEYIVQLYKKSINDRIVQDLFCHALKSSDLDLVIYLNNLFNIKLKEKIRLCKSSMVFRDEYKIFEYFLSVWLDEISKDAYNDTKKDIFYHMCKCRNLTQKDAKRLLKQITDTYHDRIPNQKYLDYCQLLLSCVSENLPIFKNTCVEYKKKYNVTPILLKKLLKITIKIEDLLQLSWLLDVTGNDINCFNYLIVRNAHKREYYTVIRWLHTMIPDLETDQDDLCHLKWRIGQNDQWHISSLSYRRRKLIESGILKQ